MLAVNADVSRRAAMSLLALGLTPAACGGGDVVVEPAPTPKQRGVAPPAGGTVASDPLREPAHDRARLTITVDDSAPGSFRYRAPRTVRGGLVEIRLRNMDDVPHKAQLWRIEGDHTVQEALKIRHPQPDWLRTAGGVSLTEPGAASTTLQALPAGRYYVAATLGRPGTVAAFEVTAPETVPPPPRAPARVQAIDFSFKVSGLRPGRNSVDFDNAGREPHHAFFTPIRPGRSLEDVKRFFARATSTGPPPVDAEATRETAILEGRERQVTELNFAAGRYAVICFVRNRAGGPPHIDLGMINEVTVR